MVKSVKDVRMVELQRDLFRTIVSLDTPMVVLSKVTLCVADDIDKYKAAAHNQK
jgi:hypothetical protein